MKFPAFHFVSVAFCLVTRPEWTESPSSIIFTLFIRYLHTLLDSFIQAAQSQLSQTLYVSDSAGPSSSSWIFTGLSLLYDHISLVMGNPDLDSVPQISLCWIEKKNHLPWSTGNSAPKATLIAILAASVCYSLMVYWLSIRTPKTFPVKFLSKPVGQSLYWDTGLLVAVTLHFTLLSLMRFFSVCLSSSLRTFQMAASKLRGSFTRHQAYNSYLAPQWDLRA